MVNLYGNDIFHTIEAPCKTTTSKYFTFETIQISDYYEVIGSVHIDKNTLLVLSPTYQQGNCLNQCGKKNQERLLVLINNDKITIINKSAILNNIDYQQDPFKKIKAEKNSFSIYFEFGSIIMCNYQFSFVDRNDTYILDNEKHQCFNKGNPDLYEIKNNTFSGQQILLTDFNISKYILVPNLLDKPKEIKQFSIKTHTILYKEPSESSQSKMYLIAGDKVTLLDTKTDDAGQEWYYISYQGKKEIKAWIKAESVK
jgi:hypothetical protein